MQVLRVDVGQGLWLSAAGGVLLVVGGALSLAWIRQREAASRPTPASAPAPAAEA